MKKAAKKSLLLIGKKYCNYKFTKRKSKNNFYKIELENKKGE